MLKRFAKNHWGEKSCIAIISRTGHIYFWGRPRSLIQVLFLENRDNVAHQVKWIWKLLNQLKTNYGIPHVNLVAHSMGCVSVLMYLNQYGYDERNSKVKRVVTIGAPFNDLEVGKRTLYIEDHPLTTTGPVKMSPLYRWMKANNIGMPADIRFLNIAGNLQNGTFLMVRSRLIRRCRCVIWSGMFDGNIRSILFMGSRLNIVFYMKTNRLIRLSASF